MVVQVPFFPEARAAADYARRHDIGFVAYNHAGPDGLSEAEERVFRDSLTLHPRGLALAVSEASRDKIVGESGLDVPVRLVGQMLAVENFPPLDPARPDEAAQVRSLRAELGASSADDVLVLAPNSFIPRKMPLDLIHALHRLVESRGLHQVRLAFVGHTTFAKSAELFPLAMERVVLLGLSAQVRFCEPVEPPLLRLIYAAADIVALPGRSETFGLVLAEAGLMERAVVGYATPGIWEVVADGETGLLAPWSDDEARRVDGLAAALETLVRDPVRRSEMGRAGRRRMLAKFDPAQTLHRHEAAYAEAMA
jgi:glycosyltransferase involved in cell wall biosynthesis